MSTKTTDGKKSIVEQLDFTAKTAKRVTWESWEFTVVGPHQVKVTNASYGFEKDEHAYVVGVDERNGAAFPAECECPADVHYEKDCKHKVALAAVGGQTVLNAATVYENRYPVKDEPTSVTTAADKLETDGGLPEESHQQDEEECKDCVNLSGLPCWPCYRDGKANM